MAAVMAQTRGQFLMSCVRSWRKRSRSIERMVRPCQWPHLAEILQTSCRTWRSGGSDGGGIWVAAQGSQRGLGGAVYRAAIQRRGLAASDDGAVFGHGFEGQVPLAACCGSELRPRCSSTHNPHPIYPPGISSHPAVISTDVYTAISWTRRTVGDAPRESLPGFCRSARQESAGDRRWYGG